MSIHYSLHQNIVQFTPLVFLYFSYSGRSFLFFYFSCMSPQRVLEHEIQYTIQHWANAYSESRKTNWDIRDKILRALWNPSVITRINRGPVITAWKTVILRDETWRQREIKFGWSLSLIPWWIPLTPEIAAEISGSGENDEIEFYHLGECYKWIIESIQVTPEVAPWLDESWSK